MSIFPILHTPGHGSCRWGKLWALLQLQLKPQLQTQQQTWTWPNSCPAPLWDCLGAEGAKHSGTCQGALGIPQLVLPLRSISEKSQGMQGVEVGWGFGQAESMLNRPTWPLCRKN